MKKPGFLPRSVSGLIAALAVGVLSGAPAQATMVTYQLFDHADGALVSSVGPYGIRLDDFDSPPPQGPTFSVSSNGASVTLVWDTVLDTADITGTVYNNVDGDLYSISYLMSGLVDVSGGFVVPDAAPSNPELELTGPLPGTTTYSIPGLGNGASPTSLIFEFIADGHRLNNTGFNACDSSPAAECTFSPDTTVGRGWLDGSGTNDFLVTAQVVPLPGALWLLISGMGALFGVRGLTRRRITV